MMTIIVIVIKINGSADVAAPFRPSDSAGQAGAKGRAGGRAPTAGETVGETPGSECRLNCV